MSEKSYYELLGVDKSASTEAIRTAYREIARVYHPDSNFYDEILDEILPPEAMGKFQEITAAYNTLVSEEKRKAYNETLPPELIGWDDGVAAEDRPSHKNWVKSKVRDSNVYAMGQFGNLDSSSARCEEDDETEVLTVDEIISNNSIRWHKKVWNLICGSFFSAR